MAKVRTTRGFWVDAAYDVAAASDGASRFRCYLLKEVGEGALDAMWDGSVRDDADRAGEFCAAVWPLAIPPRMAPGYVRWHPRVISGSVEVNSWDGDLVGRVRLVAPWPEAIVRSRDRLASAAWRDRPVERQGDAVVYLDPGSDDLAERSYLTSELTLAFPLALRSLVPAPAGPRDDVEARARFAISEVVNALCAAVDPVLAALEAGGR